MSGKAKPAASAYFSRGGRAGRHPGDGWRNKAGTSPHLGTGRPAKGMGLAPFRRHPPKGDKP